MPSFILDARMSAAGALYIRSWDPLSENKITVYMLNGSGSLVRCAIESYRKHIIGNALVLTGIHYEREENPHRFPWTDGGLYSVFMLIYSGFMFEHSLYAVCRSPYDDAYSTLPYES